MTDPSHTASSALSSTTSSLPVVRNSPTASPSGKSPATSSFRHQHRPHPGLCCVAEGIIRRVSDNINVVRAGDGSEIAARQQQAASDREAKMTFTKEQQREQKEQRKLLARSGSSVGGAGKSGSTFGGSSSSTARRLTKNSEGSNAENYDDDDDDDSGEDDAVNSDASGVTPAFRVENEDSLDTNTGPNSPKKGSGGGGGACSSSSNNSSTSTPRSVASTDLGSSSVRSRALSSAMSGTLDVSSCSTVVGAALQRSNINADAQFRSSYSRLQLLGRGAHGETWLVEWCPPPEQQRWEEAERKRRSACVSTSSASNSPESNNNNNSNNSGTLLPAPKRSSLGDGMSSSSAAVTIAAAAASTTASTTTPAGRAIAVPPAPVSSLACTKPMVKLSDGRHIARERLFVMKEDFDMQKLRQEAEKKKKQQKQQQHHRHHHYQGGGAVMGGLGGIVPVPAAGTVSSSSSKDDDNNNDNDDDHDAAAEGKKASPQRKVKLRYGDGPRGGSSKSNSDNDSEASLSSSRIGMGNTSISNGSDNSDHHLGLSDMAELSLRRPPPLSRTSGASDETLILANCAHPCLVGFVDDFVHVDGHTRCLVMEYVDNGDLRGEILRRKQNGSCFGEASALFLFAQICTGVEYLHRHNVLHRDLKTANILLSKRWSCKICDAGFAVHTPYDVDGKLDLAPCGSPYYLSPEIFLRHPYGEKSDVWALGVILFEMLTSRRPFESQNVDQLAQDIVWTKHRPLGRPGLSEGVVALVNQMLQKNPDDRPSVKQVLQNPVVRPSLIEFVAKFERAAIASSNHLDMTWSAVLKEHVALILIDDGKSSPKSTKLLRLERRKKVAEEMRAEGVVMQALQQQQNAGNNNSNQKAGSDENGSPLLHVASERMPPSESSPVLGDQLPHK